MEYKALLEKIIERSAAPEVSDLLIVSNLPPALRINGDLSYISEQKLTAEHVLNLIHLTMGQREKDIFTQEMEIDYAYEYGTKFRFRANAFTTLNGPAVSMRKIAMKAPDINEINAPDILTDLINKDHGLILLTGPTGSGKSTTLAAIIEHINRNQRKHIITIEDPVEYIFNSNKSIINQRQLDINTKSFPVALKSALREDPDIIMVGEMRDPETIRLALTAAETGHMVLSTLHTNSAYESINRIIDVFPPDAKKLAVSLLSSSLIGVISQRLLKSKDSQSRVAAHEVLVATAAVKNLIREGKVQQIYSMMQVGSKHGMVTLQDSLDSLVARGLIHSELRDKIGMKEREIL